MMTHHNVEVIVLRSRGRSLVEPQAVATKPLAPPIRLVPAPVPPQQPSVALVEMTNATLFVGQPPGPVTLDDLGSLGSWEEMTAAMSKLQIEIQQGKKSLAKLRQTKKNTSQTKSHR